MTTNQIVYIVTSSVPGKGSDHSVVNGVFASLESAMRRPFNVEPEAVMADAEWKRVDPDALSSDADVAGGAPYWVLDNAEVEYIIDEWEVQS